MSFVKAIGSYRVKKYYKSNLNVPKNTFVGTLTKYIRQKYGTSK